MYSFSEGVVQDKTEVVQWYRKAAAHGDDYAQYELGFVYCYGLVLMQDYAEAL